MSLSDLRQWLVVGLLETITNFLIIGHLNVCWLLKRTALCSYMGVLCASVGFPVKAVSWLRRLVAGFSPARPGFAPGLVHVVLVVVKVTLGQIFSGFFGFSLSVSFHRSSLYSYVVWVLAICPLVASVQRHWLTPTTWTTTLTWLVKVNGNVIFVLSTNTISCSSIALKVNN
jgi:general stress protein CsbA